MRTAFLLLGLWLLSPGLFPQEASDIHLVPEALRRPERGEAPRYPQDLVIGVLGQGAASDGAYRFANSVLSALAAGNGNAPALADSGPAFVEGLIEEIAGIRARRYRLGGGRPELDGSISFLVRFIGHDESISGELFIRWEEERWLLDDLLLEEKRPLSEIRDSYRYDFSPYERFY